MKKYSPKALLSFLIITVSYGIMFRVSYMRNVFYLPMLSSFNLTNTQLSVMMACYSIGKIILYVPAGIIADRIGPFKSLTFSTTLLALTTFWYAMAPGYTILCVIHVLLAVANVMQLPSALKMVRSFGAADNQGKAMGFSELIRGVASLAVNFIALGLFSSVEFTAETPMQPVLLLYGGVYAVMAVLTFIFCPRAVDEEEKESPPGLRDYITCFKHPIVWCIALLTMSAYAFEVCIDYTTPYLSDIMGMTVVMAGAISIVRSFGISLLAGPLFGWYNDKFRSYSRTLIFVFIGQMAVGIAFMLTPPNPAFVTLGVVLTLLAALCIYGFTATQWTLMEELKIPQKVTATAIGMVCLIGYTPDVYMSLIIGNRLDNAPGEEAYKSVFLYGVLFAAAALLLAVLIYNIAKRRRRAEAAQAETAQA